MLFPHLHDKQVILASQSPRRLELVRGLELNPIIRLKDVDESYPDDLSGADVALYVTRKKAHAYVDEMLPNEILITGDTVVLLDNEVLGKPASVSEAREMLKKLSGRTHRVASGIAVYTRDAGLQSEVDVCEVQFGVLSDELIEHYASNYQPFDKAGAYGVQDLIGFAGVQSIRGSFFTVMGLPTHILFRFINNLD